MTCNLATTTQPSIEDVYDEEFTALVNKFVNDILDIPYFTHDEYREALEEALAIDKKENRS